MLLRSIRVLLLLAIFSVAACSDDNVDNNSNNTENSSKVKQQSATSVEEQWGVDEFSVRLSSAGYMLDVRYRVTDTIKAMPLFSRKLRPFIINEASGDKYGVPASPKIGYLRQAPSVLKENKVYFFVYRKSRKATKKRGQIDIGYW